MTRLDCQFSSRQRLARGIAQARITRRGVLAGAGGLALAVVPAACGTEGGKSAAGLSAAADLSCEPKIVSWANWTLYRDYDDQTKKCPTLQRVVNESGITTEYPEVIDTYYGKNQAQLAVGKVIGQDISTPSDWMSEWLIRQGYVQVLDHANVPNLLPELRDVRFDPGSSKFLAGQSGFTGIAWNKEALSEDLKNVSDLWGPALEGRVAVLDETRDTTAMMLPDEGIDIQGNWGEAEYGNLLEVLEQNIKIGQIRQVKGNSYKQGFISGNAIAGLVYTGDIAQLNFEEGDKWDFVMSEAKGPVWSDNFMVPIGATQKTNADNPLIFPTEEFLARSSIERVMGVEEETQFQDMFQQVIGA
ncbi:ABC transporter substrate-binding protein [Paeniglutamicibacter antarcticus]|uniref:Spermidine/putrescine transport system substrate-binding protein n=1 Tax=Paeniglutamicibacter antarcticus TaxID=494023 RepID=A0ABP9TNG8_9MICC